MTAVVPSAPPSPPEVNSDGEEMDDDGDGDGGGGQKRLPRSPLRDGGGGTSGLDVDLVAFGVDDPQLDTREGVGDVELLDALAHHELRLDELLSAVRVTASGVLGASLVHRCVVATADRPEQRER